MQVHVVSLELSRTLLTMDRQLGHSNAFLAWRFLVMGDCNCTDETAEKRSSEGNPHSATWDRLPTKERESLPGFHVNALLQLSFWLNYAPITLTRLAVHHGSGNPKIKARLMLWPQTGREGPLIGNQGLNWILGRALPAGFNFFTCRRKNGNAPMTRKPNVSCCWGDK